MTAAEERLEVLKMIQNGQITADEGARLLEALKEKDRPKEKPLSESRSRAPRLFRIRVTDLETGQEKVNMRMPWNLVNVGVNMGARFARDEIQVDEFAEAIQAGAKGRIMDVLDEEANERVEIFVE
ncbi:MAG: hypothetical protein GY832_03210 [Chloroflexi bacterium]|nr:hypothetical protein [Chloroflexota bacterium]